MHEFIQRMHANGYELIIFTAATQARCCLCLFTTSAISIFSLCIVIISSSIIIITSIMKTLGKGQ